MNENVIHAESLSKEYRRGHSYSYGEDAVECVSAGLLMDAAPVQR